MFQFFFIQLGLQLKNKTDTLFHSFINQETTISKRKYFLFVRATYMKENSTRFFLHLNIILGPLIKTCIERLILQLSFPLRQWNWWKYPLILTTNSGEPLSAIQTASSLLFLINLHNFILSLVARGVEERRTTARGLSAILTERIDQYQHSVFTLTKTIHPRNQWEKLLPSLPAVRE